MYWKLLFDSTGHKKPMIAVYLTTILFMTCLATVYGVTAEWVQKRKC